MGLQALGMRVAVSDESHPRPNFRISIPKAVSLCVLSCDLMVMVQVSMKLLDAKQENMLSLVSLFTMVRSCDVFLGRKYFLSLPLSFPLLFSTFLYSPRLFSFLRPLLLMLYSTPYATAQPSPQDTAGSLLLERIFTDAATRLVMELAVSARAAVLPHVSLDVASSFY